MDPKWKCSLISLLLMAMQCLAQVAILSQEDGSSPLPDCRAVDAMELIHKLEGDDCDEISVEDNIDLGLALKKGRRIDLKRSKVIYGALNIPQLPEINVRMEWIGGYVGDEPLNFAVNLRGLVNKGGRPLVLEFKRIHLVNVKLGQVAEGVPLDVSYILNECVIQASPPKNREGRACKEVQEALWGQKSNSTVLLSSYHGNTDRVYPWDYPKPYSLEFNGIATIEAHASFVVIRIPQEKSVVLWCSISGICMFFLFVVVVTMKLNGKPLQMFERTYTFGDSILVAVTSVRLGSRGAYGKVYEALLTRKWNFCSINRKIKVAAKEVEWDEESTHGNAELGIMAHREMQLSTQCKHKNIVKCYGVVDLSCEGGIHYIVVMEKLHQDLHKLIHSDEMFRRRCTYRELIKIFKGIVSGLQYLHNEMKWIHFDLKPRNILVTTSNCCKLADFGMSKICGDGSVNLTGVKGSRWYSAPEASMIVQFENTREQKVNRSVDIYSLGVIMWECVTRREPGVIVRHMAGYHTHTIQMYSEGVSFPLDCNCHARLSELIERCVHFDPAVFLNKLSADEHGSEDFGRPSLEGLQEAFGQMLSEDWVDDKPPDWR